MLAVEILVPGQAQLHSCGEQGLGQWIDIAQSLLELTFAHAQDVIGRRLETGGYTMLGQVATYHGEKAEAFFEGGQAL